MELQIFTIFDSKAGAFLQPFFSRNSATALRSFEQAVQDENSDFHKYASDYTLFHIGSWFEDEGRLVELEAKVPLGEAIQYLRQASLEAVK